jgi:hypothetical protein
MPGQYYRYQQGLYQEVYDELLAMREQVFEDSTYEEALLVARTMMKRVRHNIELLIPRLHLMGYHFGEGLSESSEEAAFWEQEAPTYQAPTLDTPDLVARLEQFAGTLPLTLKCWYEEVGSVNFVGTFPISDERKERIAYGSLLDPLFIYSAKMALTIGEDDWNVINDISIAPDRFFKYRYSGSGPYSIKTPCKMFDASLEGYEIPDITFVRYLRLCFRWGGFPGLEKTNRLSSEQLEFLTKDLLPF